MSGHAFHRAGKLSTYIAAMSAIASCGMALGAPEEILGLRLDMPGQGYLQYKVNPSAGVNRFGEELTGWIDVRHPLQDGTTNVFEPYDRSNHYINEHSILVSDSTGAAAAPDMLRDWDRSSKIYAQAGISTPRISSGSAALGVTWANFDATQRLNLANAGTGRAADATTLNMYYAKNFGGNTSNGLSIQPLQTNGTSVLNPYSYVRDGSADSTQPHEAGHQLLNGNALFNEVPGSETESSDTKNWMHEFGVSYSYQEIGRNNGRIENVQKTRLYANGGANNPGFVQRRLNLENYGDRVDWNFVQDDRTLETVGGTADDHPGTLESLYFAPGTTSSPSETGHVKTGLPGFSNTPDYVGTFRYADVFSMTTRYLDFDRFDANSDFSLQNGALDYEVFFVDALNNIVPGTLTTIFDFGWTTSTVADNYLARWSSPVDAVGMYVFSKSITGTFDGNAQIDAVIVSNVPEPSLLALSLTGALLLLRRR